MNPYSEVHFKNIQKKIVEHLEQSRESILVAVAWVTDMFIINKLLECQNRGVKVSIIFYSDSINNKDLFKKLHDNGSEIMYTNKLMHNKFCVIDKTTIINGSYNWTNNASNNHENIQITFYDKNLSNNYIVEFDKLKRQSKSIDEYFKSNEEKYLDFIEKEPKPKKYPFFIKLDFSKFIIISYQLQKLKNKYIYIFIKDENDFEYFQDFIFNNQIRNENYSLKKFKLQIFDNVYETQKNNFDSEFNNKYFDYSGLNENELYEKNGYLKLDDVSYGKLTKQTIDELYDILFCYKDRIPLHVNSIDDLKKHVKTYYEKLDYKSYYKISEEIIIYKMYFRLPISFNTYSEVNYENDNFDRYSFHYLENDQCTISTISKIYTSTTTGTIENISNKFFRINSLGEKISEEKTFTNYNNYKGHYELEKYKHKIFSHRKHYIIYYEKNIINNFYNKNDTRTLYGILDKEGKILVPAMFDYIKMENSTKIVFETLPFATLDLNKKYNTISVDHEKNIINNQLDKILKFEYNYLENELKQINFSKLDSTIYLSEQNGKFANFYKEIILITKDSDQIRYLKEYFLKNNFMNLDQVKIKNLIISKINEINKINKSPQTNQNCYIATLVYEDINHPKVEALRNFRDEKLNNYKIGRNFTKIYYTYSPRLVKTLKNKKIITKIIKYFINILIKLIKPQI